VQLSLAQRAPPYRSGYVAIFEFLRGGSFDAETTRAMGEAFDAACEQLGETGLHFVVRETIAREIIEAANDGERDPARMCATALASFGDK
jgi:hypothetical protein